MFVVIKYMKLNKNYELILDVPINAKPDLADL